MLKSFLSFIVKPQFNLWQAAQLGSFLMVFFPLAMMPRELINVPSMASCVISQDCNRYQSAIADFGGVADLAVAFVCLIWFEYYTIRASLVLRKNFPLMPEKSGGRDVRQESS